MRFLILAWHAGVLRGASQAAALPAALADGLGAPSGNPFGARDFHLALAYRALCPGLGAKDSSVSRLMLASVRAYCGLLSGASRLQSLLRPAVSPIVSRESWIGRELALCSSYARAALAHRLQANSSSFAHSQSF